MTDNKPLDVVELFEQNRRIPFEKDNYTILESQISEVWSSYFDHTIHAIEADPIYNSYPVREKALSFFYTYLLELQPNRDFNVYCLRKKDWKTPLKYACLLHNEPKIRAYFSQLIEQGLDTGELASRALLSARYGQFLWTAFVFSLDFWKNDNSEHFESSDIAVERAVHLAFDAMSPNFLDSGLEMAQFIWKNKNNYTKK